MDEETEYMLCSSKNFHTNYLFFKANKGSLSSACPKFKAINILPFLWASF